MKKILHILIAAVMGINLCLLWGCGEDERPDPEKLAQSMKSYISDSFDNKDCYIQISRTKAAAQTITEVSELGEDKCFLTYDFSGALKFFRNGKFTDVNPTTIYTPNVKDADWDTFSFGKTADNYREVLKKLCADKNGSEYAVREVTLTDTENEKLPYKVSVSFDVDKFDCGKLFASGGNFGSLSVKFLTDQDGSTFDNVTLHVQYDYDSEIFVTAAKFGTPKTPDENNGNGERPEDVEEMYNGYLKKMQTSFEEYLQSIQQTE